ncbi:hypothetical protein [Legionella parisiensis]|uniref:Uncharacterized protein n=1 Tax=Legionella parisiensis TaxID=45071 RepID=A0A1E5JS18_9GAMM|nr:hypothetical protein [Legionella parisiensis]KTD41083.1 hypothetical protein Lpar_2400 [Legionella parisiensis]OEH47305.1 hypothetical protein lpari_01787 [Legionella parisiensis]STX76622.1 Uncharacterised protein [Legionella parisiensis]
MFELEIMVTAYTVFVATTTSIICKFIGKNKLKKMANDLSLLKKTLMDKESEMNRLKSERIA